MSNMTVNERNQYERVDLSVPTTGVGVRRRWLVAVYTVIATLLVIGLGYAAVTLMDGWARVLVFGVIVLTVIGTMIAVSPNRRA